MIDERQIIDRLVAIYAEARKAAPGATPRAVAYWDGVEHAIRDVANMLGVSDRLPRALPDGAHSLARLTRREREIAAMLVEGLTGKQVAERLVVSENTMRTHKRHIYRKLNIGSRAELLGALGNVQREEVNSSSTK